jgi:FkbM family methyltransferase
MIYDMFKIFYLKIIRFLKMKNKEKMIILKKKFLFLLKSLLNKLKIQPILIKRYGAYFYLFNDEISDGIFCGSYEADELRMLLNLIKIHKEKNVIFLDIGANLGFYSIILGKLFEKNGLNYTVISIEPSPREFDRLKKNIEVNNLKNVILKDIAISDFNGKSKFFITKNKTGLSSLEKPEEDQSLQILVKTMKLDDFLKEIKIEKVDIMKIDVEGAELKVLKGGAETLKKYKPLLMIEVSDKRTWKFNYKAQDILNFLKNNGYKFFIIKNSYLKDLEEKNFYDDNVFAIPDEKIEDYFYLLEEPPSFITFVTTPKPFKDFIKIIQYNSIKSWLLLKPKPEIILVGDEYGVKDVVHDFGLKNISEIKRNQYGTPLINDIFEKVQNLSTHNIICYLNTDIILNQKFIDVIVNIIREIKLKFSDKQFLIIGRRTDLKIDNLIDFDKNWEEEIFKRARKEGKLLLSGIDFFVFEKGFLKNLPPFNLVFKALKEKAIVVDITDEVMVIHQSHGYQHHPFGEKMAGKGPEEIENMNYAREVPHRYQIFDATYKFYKGKLKLNLIGKFHIKSSFYRLLDFTRPIREKLFLTKSKIKKLIKQ